MENTSFVLSGLSMRCTWALVRKKYRKKAMAAKRSFLSIAHPILQAWQDTRTRRTRTTMLQCFLTWFADKATKPQQVC